MATAATLAVLPGEFTIYRFPPDTPDNVLPDAATRAGAALFALVRTTDELSLLCPSDWALTTPADTGDRQQVGPWRALRFVGTLDFALTGVIARLGTALADAGISVFVQSTFDTDYVLVRSESLPATLKTLGDAGYRFDGDNPAE